MIQRAFLRFSIAWFGLSLAFPAPATVQERKFDDFKTLSRVERNDLVVRQLKALSASLQDDPRHEDLKQSIITGNQIRVLVTNQGSISTPNADNSNADLVWPSGPSGLGYAFEFGPLVGAEVIDDNGDTVQIVNDGFIRLVDGDFEPGTTNKWGWEPRIGFSDPASSEVAHFSDLDRDGDGKPDSWPQSFFNDVLGRFVWPAFLGDDSTTPDEEVFYVMDDFDNAEFDYFPSPADSTIRGLGLELRVRIFQFNNPLAEDMIFLVYTITNISPRTINKVFLGMFGDPHVGGPNDFADDNANFISAFNESFPFDSRNMLFAFDADGRGDQGKTPGYFGYRFLESPGIDSDGQDNDNDGLTDESPFNDAGVFAFGPIGRFGADKLHWSGDEDGDWDPEFDDVGVDGIAGTGDRGEGDGRPNQLFFLDLNNNSMLDPGEPTSEMRLEGMRFRGGEPNFGFLDTAESDQLGLTSFNAIAFGGNNRPRQDDLMYNLMSTPNQRPGDPEPEIEQESDNVFIYGSGPFTLRPGESQRFSIALLLGQDLTDLVSNAQISQQVFEADYRFAQAPKKPTLVAVPGDEQVTLYWDTVAEESFDPFVARANPDSARTGFDFEGYKIYRSQDFSFNDTQTITDSRGVPFLSVPLLQKNGVPAQFDLVNQFQGLSEVEFAGRGVRFNLGQNSGLVHSFVDSNNVQNGVTYFYAVTSYDHGDVAAQLSPTESQRTIQRDAVTRLFTFDINTAQVVPGDEPIGFVEPKLDGSEGNLANQVIGNATGSVAVQFLEPFAVKNGKAYDIVFEDVVVDSLTTVTGYSVIDLQPVTTTFVARDTIFVNLLTRNLVAGSISVTELGGSVIDPSAYEVDLMAGRIRGSAAGSLPEGQSFNITFQFAPVARSIAVNNEDDNPVFDGMRLFVQNQETALSPLAIAGGRSGFKTIETGTNFSDENTVIGLSQVGRSEAIATDFEIQFVNYDTTADGRLSAPADSSIKIGNAAQVKTPFRIIDTSTGENISFFINEISGFRNQRWDYTETIVLLKPNFSQFVETTYQVKFNTPADTIKTADGSADSLIVVDDPIYPGDGDVFFLFSEKPFEVGDKYAFSTKAVSFDNQTARNALDDVIVVPNPYVAFSAAEIAGVRTGARDDRRIEFRNLPQRCTIRIYTVVGELVDTIEKDDNRDFAVWDLLTFESQETSYGVYIYHIDAPGIGTKIGRLALIK